MFCNLSDVPFIVSKCRDELLRIARGATRFSRLFHDSNAFSQILLSAVVTQLLNATVCLAFLVCKVPKMKLFSCCREIKMQHSGPTLRSLANFYVEFELCFRNISF